jgi:hypothetical protein
MVNYRERIELVKGLEKSGDLFEEVVTAHQQPESQRFRPK